MIQSSLVDYFTFQSTLLKKVKIIFKKLLTRLGAREILNSVEEIKTKQMNYQEFFAEITAMELEGVSEIEIDLLVREAMMYGKALFQANKCGMIVKWVS